jgi:hypothetical protein
MKNLENAAKAKIEELADKAAFVTEEKGQVWSKDENGAFVHIFETPVQASFTKKENKEQVPYSGFAYGVKFEKTGEKEGADKYNQIVLGVFSKLGDTEQSELEVRRTRVTSGEKNFKRVPTKALEAAI